MIWDESHVAIQGEPTPEHLTPFGRFIAIYVPMALIGICVALAWGIAAWARGGAR